MHRTPRLTDDAMPKRAYSYRRISYGGRQARGSGLDRQNIAEQLCQEHGWILDDTLKLTDRAKSGFHKHNLKPTAALGRFLALIDSGRISPGEVLIVESLDRLSRAELDEAYDLFRRILKAEISIATWEPRRIYTRQASGNMLDLLEPLFVFARAHEESNIKSLRVKGAWRLNREQSAPMHLAEAPAWLRRTPSGYEPIPERVEVVRRIFRLTLGGFGQQAIADTFTREGVPALGRSAKWNGVYIRRIVRGRQVLGDYQPHQLQDGKRVPAGAARTGHYPAVVTEADWFAAQAATDFRRRKAGRPAADRCNLFTGLFFDADTRLPLHVCSTTHRSGERYPYLSPEVKGAVSIRYDDAERCILDTLAMLRPEDVVPPNAHQKEHDRAVADLAAQLTALDHRERQLQQAAASPDQDVSVLLPVLNSVAQERKAIAMRLQRLKLDSLSGRAEALAEAQTLRGLRDRTQGEERRELDQRIKAALPCVVSSIWAKSQTLSARRRIVHLQIWLHSGQCRYVQLLPRNLRGVNPEDWSAADFRRGT